MLTLATYHFPEFVPWLASTYIPHRNCVASSIREVILEVTSDLIHKDFYFLDLQNPKPLNEDSIGLDFTQLSKHNKLVLFAATSLLGTPTPQSVETYLMYIFSQDAQKVLASIFVLLEEDKTTNVTKSALWFLSHM